MNKVILVGRLTRDPELRFTTDGKPVAGFTLAVDGMKKDDTTFIKVVVWGKQAENCSQYLEKGSLAGVDGRLSIRSYEDRSGEKKYVTEVVAREVKFLSGKGRPNDYQPAIADEDVPF